MRIKISDIRIDGGTQSRAAINDAVVAEYAEALTNGAILPPVKLFFDGVDHWLADGFHRFHAHRKIGALEIDADEQNGTQSDAKLFSYGANQSHGLRRTNEDKKKSVLGMLADFGDWSDNRIAKHVGVDNKTVSAHRNSVSGEAGVAETRQVTRNGKTYQQKTANIGRVKAPEPEVAAPAKTAEPEKVEAITPESSPSNEAPYDDFGPSDEEMAFHEEKEKADQAAYDALVDVAMSDDRLAEALRLVAAQAEEIARLRAELRVVKESRDSHMNAKNEAIRMVKSLQAKLKKLDKAAA